MYLTHTKVIYEPYEHLTRFHPDADELPSYDYLKTRGEYSKYGINKVPVYITRDSKIEKGLMNTRIRPEMILKENESSKLTKKLNTLKARLWQRRLIMLYESVRIFESGHHKLSGNIEAQECMATYMNPFEGYKINELTTCYYIWEGEDMYYVDCKNTVPVICEKCLGAVTYDNPGVPLEVIDVINIKENLKLNFRKIH